MKKLFCLVLTCLLSKTMLGMENPFTHLIPSIFRVPPLITQIAQYGARIFKLDQIPLICQSEDFCLCGMAIPKTVVTQLLVNPKIKNHWLRGLLSDPLDVINSMQLTLFRAPQDIIMFNPDILLHRYDYAITKHLVLHELWHCKQAQESYKKGITLHLPYENLDKITIDRTEHPRGCEQEADMQAARAINCHVCISNLGLLGKTQPHPPGYATSEEFMKIANGIPKDQLCAYHTAIVAELKRNGQLAPSMRGLTNFVKECSIKDLLHTFRSLVKSKPNKNISIKLLELEQKFLEKKYAPSIKERIARGELEP